MTAAGTPLITLRRKFNVKEIMYMPISPCTRDCKLRGEYCLSCDKRKIYEKARAEYYEYKYRQGSVNRSYVDKKTVRLKKAKRFINGTLK